MFRWVNSLLSAARGKLVRTGSSGQVSRVHESIYVLYKQSSFGTRITSQNCICGISADILDSRQGYTVNQSWLSQSNCIFSWVLCTIFSRPSWIFLPPGSLLAPCWPLTAGPWPCTQLTSRTGLLETRVMNDNIPDLVRADNKGTS